MKLKALITTLVLGSSLVASVAVAHPVNGPVVRDHRAPMGHDHDCATAHPTPAPIYQPAPRPAPIYQPGYQEPGYQEPGYQEPGYQEPAYYQGRGFYRPPLRRARWITLGAVDDIVDGEMAFRVGRSGERFTKLKLASEGGKSLIHRVEIRFANGRTRTVELNQYLNASNPTITIELDGRARAISKVTVIGRNARQSAYRVLAI